MAQITTGILLLTAMLMAAKVVSAQAPSPGGPNCAASLAVCLTAMQGANPSKECCSALKTAIQTQLSCICSLFAGVIDPKIALSIPNKCDLSVDANICSASHTPSPPAAAPKAGSSPTDEKDAAAKLSRNGLVGLILISITMMVY